MCTLTGTADNITAARAQINAVIANEGNRMGGMRNGGGGGGGGGMGGGGGGGMSGNFEMMIEGPLVARMIGKGGENIKRLQEETGAKIVIIQVGERCGENIFSLHHSVVDPEMFYSEFLRVPDPAHVIEHFWK